MDQQALDLAKNAARASVTYAGIFAGVYLIIEILSKIPIVGVAFYCLNALLSLAAFFAVAYLITPKLLPLPAGQTKAMLALSIGGGVAATVTVAFLIVTLIVGIFALIIAAAVGGSSSAFSSTVGGVGTLIVRLIGALVFGVIIGTALAFLGSYVAFERNKDMQQVARPF